MGAISLNNHYLSVGECSVNGRSTKNFTVGGRSSLVGLVCANQFRSSGHTQIQSSRLNTVNVSGSSRLIQSTANAVRSFGKFEAVDCPKLGKIVGFGRTVLTHCHDVDELNVSGKLVLDYSKVRGNVTVFGKAVISESTIGGALECAARVVEISNSCIGQVIIKPSNKNYRIQFFPNWRTPIAFRSSPSSPLVEQVVELSGKGCRIGSISFVEGAVGKVRLANGATISSVNGAEVVSQV